jgi:hypothetical protein
MSVLVTVNKFAVNVRAERYKKPNQTGSYRKVPDFVYKGVTIALCPKNCKMFSFRPILFARY